MWESVNSDDKFRITHLHMKFEAANGCNYPKGGVIGLMGRAHRIMELSKRHEKRRWNFPQAHWAEKRIWPQTRLPFNLA